MCTIKRKTILDKMILLGIGIVSISMLASAENFTWKNVKIGGGGGFIPNIVYNTTKPGLVYTRTDMGGIYRLDSISKKWIPLTDWVAPEKWNLLGGESIATDPVEPNRFYVAAGTYTNDWTDMNGFILRSKDYGNTFELSEMPFKFGGNMPGRGMGERLVIDPNSNNILYFGARSGNGLWKSTDFGETWSKVSSFPVEGDYIQDPNFPYTADKVGIVWIAFDKASSTSGNPTQTIFVGAAQKSGPTVFVSEDAGATWSAVEGQPLGGGNDTSHIKPHHGVIRDSILYIPYNNKCGPYDGNYGEVWKYNIRTKTWTDITPHTHVVDEAWESGELKKEDCYFGYGGFDVDYQNPNVIIAATLNSWWPDAALYRSEDGGASWTKSFYWTVYPTAKFKYEIETVYPWLNWGVTSSSWPDVVYPKLGWMISGLAINPFNSNELMYGTGATIYGTQNLNDWGSAKKVIFKSVAEGIEECAVLSLAVPPITSGTGSNVKLLSGVGDIGGFAHTDLETSTQMYLTPRFTNTTSIDYAELDPKQVIRVGTSSLDRYEQFCNIGSSSDGGLTWTKIYVNYDSSYNSGTVAMSSKGSTILWAPSGKAPVYGSLYGLKETTLPADVWVASDRVNDSMYYAFKDSIFYYGPGSSFTKSTEKLPFTSSKIKAVPGLTGHVWLPAEFKGLWRTKDGGKTFSQIDSTVIQKADVVGFGKAAPGSEYPAIYITGKVHGKTGIFMSKDEGATWIRINDDAHQYGSINYAITGDMRQYGIVFVATNGRGIVYGTPSGTNTVTYKPGIHSNRKIIRTGSIVSVIGKENLNLFDLRGILVRTGRSDGKQARIDLSGLSKGIYIARCGVNLSKTIVVR